MDMTSIVTGDELLVAPGVFDGISANLVARFGFPAAYMTGAGVAASGFGLPDIGLVTQTEMVERAWMLTSVLGDIPLIADADTGYGQPLNVARTVRQYERAGVAALQLEDQAFPKQQAHRVADKELVDPAEFLGRLRAALDVRDRMLILARTDALGPLGLDAAIERANAYVDAGADLIFVLGLRTAQDVERAGALINAPQLISAPDGAVSEPRLAELGFRLAIHPSSVPAAAVSGLLTQLATLTKGVDATPPRGLTEFGEFAGLADWTALAERIGQGG